MTPFKNVSWCFVECVQSRFVMCFSHVLVSLQNQKVKYESFMRKLGQQVRLVDCHYKR